MTFPLSRCVVLLLALAWLISGCDPRNNPAWSLAGEPGLLYDVKLYYERNAYEEAGLCRNPIMDGITVSEILDDTDDVLTVRVRYAYHDYVMTGEDCDRFRPNRCFMMQQCQGFGARTFRLARNGEAFERVIEMSGSQRRRN